MDPAGGTGRRLLVLSHTGLVSGAEVVLLRAMEMARSGGWAVEALAPAGAFTDRARNAGFPVAPIPDLKLPALPGVVAEIVSAARSARAARRLRRRARHADVVLLNGIFGLPALRLARISTPSAWLVHDVIHRRSWKLLLRAVGSAADLAIAVSDAVAAPLRDQGLETAVVRNGTTWPVDPVPSPAGGPPVIGCAALLTPWKGQRVLLDAVAALEDQSVTVELLGGRFPKDAPYVAGLEARAAEADLAGRVRFLGHQADPLARMRTWTVGALPSIDPEAGPLALLEYMSIGLPVVATDHGGTPEVIGDAGLLVPPGSASGLAAAITTLLADPVRRTACGAAGRANVEHGLTLDHQRAALLDVLDRLDRRPR
jgi:glycosyltransferase involved in cell wall biosynthesis